MVFPGEYRYPLNIFFAILRVSSRYPLNILYDILRLSSRLPSEDPPLDHHISWVLPLRSANILPISSHYPPIILTLSSKYPPNPQNQFFLKKTYFSRYPPVPVASPLSSHYPPMHPLNSLPMIPLHPPNDLPTSSHAPDQ